MTSKFHSLVSKFSNGTPAPFSAYVGKVVLIVNVASKCGFTPQYKGLEELWKKYGEKGLVILGMLALLLFFELVVKQLFFFVTFLWQVLLNSFKVHCDFNTPSLPPLYPS